MLERNRGEKPVVLIAYPSEQMDTELGTGDLFRQASVPCSGHGLIDLGTAISAVKSCQQRGHSAPAKEPSKAVMIGRVMSFFACYVEQTDDTRRHRIRCWTG